MSKEEQRKLTKDELRRLETYEKKKVVLENEGYRAKLLTLGALYVNVMALVVSLPIILPAIWLFVIKNPNVNINLDSQETFVLLAIFLILVVIHELIHGVTWAIFAESHLKAIAFGFIVKYLTPYCACAEPLKKKGYLMGGLMPTILLGVIPLAISVVTGSEYLLWLAALNVMGGGGDMLIAMKILMYRDKSKESLYLDHPVEIGVVVFEK